MNREVVKQIVANLDAEVPKEGAEVKIVLQNGRMEESELVANEGGYLRLGIELLKAGLSEPKDQQYREVEVDVDYLITPDSNLFFENFSKREKVGEPLPKPTLLQNAGALGLTGAFFLAVILFMIGVSKGCGAVSEWVTK